MATRNRWTHALYSSLSSGHPVKSIIRPCAGKRAPDCSDKTHRPTVDTLWNPFHDFYPSRCACVIQALGGEWIDKTHRPTVDTLWNLFHAFYPSRCACVIGPWGRMDSRGCSQTVSFYLWAIWGSLPCTGTYYTRHQVPQVQRHFELYSQAV